MPPEDAPIGRAERAGRIDVFGLARGHRFGANESRQSKPPSHAEQDDQAWEPHRSPEGQHGDEEQHTGNRKKRVQHSHHHRVRASTDVSGDEPERSSDRHRHQHRERGDSERDARTGHHSREQIAAQLIGAERMLPRRRGVLETDDIELLDTRRPEEKGSDDRRDDEESDDHQRPPRRSMRAEPLKRRSRRHRRATHGRVGRLPCAGDRPRGCRSRRSPTRR